MIFLLLMIEEGKIFMSDPESYGGEWGLEVIGGSGKGKYGGRFVFGDCDFRDGGFHVGSWIFRYVVCG